MVDAARPNCRAIERNEHFVLSPLEISSRSKRLSVSCLVVELADECRRLARSPKRPKRIPGQIDVRLNSWARQPASDPRSQTAEPPSNKCDVAVSWPTPLLAKRLVCCADQLNPTRQSGRSISASVSQERAAQARTCRTAPPDRPAEDPSSIQSPPQGGMNQRFPSASTGGFSTQSALSGPSCHREECLLLKGCRCKSRKSNDTENLTKADF